MTFDTNTLKNNIDSVNINNRLNDTMKMLQKSTSFQGTSSSVTFKGQPIEKWLEKISILEEIVKTMREEIKTDIDKSKTDLVDCIVNFLENRGIINDATAFNR